MNPTVGQTGPVPCRRRDAFEQGSQQEPAPEERPVVAAPRWGWQGRPAGLLPSQAAGTKPSRHQITVRCHVKMYLTGKMKLNKPNYHCNQITAVELGPLNWGWRGWVGSCHSRYEHLGVHVPALLPLPRQDKEAQFRHQLFFKVSSA